MHQHSPLCSCDPWDSGWAVTPLISPSRNTAWKMSSEHPELCLHLLQVPSLLIWQVIITLASLPLPSRGQRRTKIKGEETEQDRGINFTFCKHTNVHIIVCYFNILSYNWRLLLFSLNFTNAIPCKLHVFQKPVPWSVVMVLEWTPEEKALTKKFFWLSDGKLQLVATLWVLENAHNISNPLAQRARTFPVLQKSEATFAKQE